MLRHIIRRSLSTSIPRTKIITTHPFQKPRENDERFVQKLILSKYWGGGDRLVGKHWCQNEVFHSAVALSGIDFPTPNKYDPRFGILGNLR